MDAPGNGLVVRGVTPSDKVLAHFGVLGMKWGVRKEASSSVPKQPKGEHVLTKKFETGDQVSIYKRPMPPIARAMSRISKTYAEEASNYHSFTFHDKSGQRVGEGAFGRVSKDELYLEWLGIKSRHRGKGYASAAMKGVVKYAKGQGIKKLSLEVPGNSPDARHIYEKLGFQMNRDNPMLGSKNDVWGGLQMMTLHLDRAQHSEDSDDVWEEEFASEFAEVLSANFSKTPQTVKHSSPEDVLAHFGVLGMKWGQKKARPPASADSDASAKIKEKAKTGKVKALSNTELQAAINRMQLEQNYKRLAVNDKPAVTRFVSSTLLEIGKREVQAAAAKKIGGIVARKLVTGGLG